MTEYVFSSTLKVTEWDNSSLRSGSAITEAATLQDKASGDLLICGHTGVAEAFMCHGLADLLDLSIHPMLAGRGDLLVRDGLGDSLRLVPAKCFGQIVQITYQLQARPYHPGLVS